jgi:outer membrane protein OmpA-like peptidoglycan-associated protein
MKLILLTGTAVAALTMAASSAMAEQPNGYYVAGDLGINWKSDQKLKSDNKVPSGVGPYQYNLSTKDANVAVMGRLGYRFSQKWRVEAELGYRPGKVDQMVGPRTQFFAADQKGAKGFPDSAICGSVTATTCTSPHGHMDQTSLFANAIRDFAPDYRFHPFLGLGLGVVSANTSVNGVISRTGEAITIKGNKLQPAVQGLAGFSYALSPRTSLEVSYRLMGVNKMKYTSSLPATGDFSGTYSNQSVTVGLRYTFGTPPAPPPPPAPMMAPPPPPAPVMAPPPPAPVAPAPAPSNVKQFVVYFRFDRSNLTKDAEAVVKAAADYSKTGSVSKVLVTGYTDTSGSSAYNMKLSERRAKSTAKGLAAHGVDKSKLSLDWKGENDLAVPTPDGTKEPANRRSTIDIMF